MSADGHQKRARDFKTLAAIYEGKEGEKSALNADFYISRLMYYLADCNKSRWGLK